MKILKPILKYIVAPLCLTWSLPALSKCLDTGVQLQVLGSGGPGASGGRASSGYLLWIDGVSRIMVDAGSGTKDQFHRSDANTNDIELVALSHFHPDHSAELPAIFWPFGGSFVISGPTGGQAFPSIEQFLTTMFGENGAYEVLGPRLELDITTVDATAKGSTSVWSKDNILVSGRGVPHGDVPTIAYKFEFGETSIVFASDQNGSDREFKEFIQGVDYLVIHLAVPENAAGVLAKLHAKPSVWGEIAATARAGHVIVSHISAPTSQVLEESVAIVRNNYSGSLTLGEDLMCIGLL
jgi:ribonuclease BN (tRNA processing enzyme)